MKYRERMKGAERAKSVKAVLLLLALSIAVVMIYSGILSDMYWGITMSVSEYRDIKEQFNLMHDNISAADMYVSKDAGLPDVYIWDKICLYPEDVMIFLNDLCESNGMEITRLKFYHEADEENSTAALTSEIEIECTYELLLSFMDDVKNTGVNAAVGSVNVLELGGGRISAVARLNFYILN